MCNQPYDEEKQELKRNPLSDVDSLFNRKHPIAQMAYGGAGLGSALDRPESLDSQKQRIQHLQAKLDANLKHIGELECHVQEVTQDVKKLRAELKTARLNLMQMADV